MTATATKRGDAGFTMIEVLIALAILTIGLLALATRQIAATHGNTIGAKLSQGTTMAQDKLEELVSLDYDDPDLQDTDGDGAAGLNDTGANADYTENHPGYDVFWNVNVEAGGEKRVTVIAAWGIATRGARTSTLTTIIPDL